MKFLKARKLSLPVTEALFDLVVKGCCAPGTFGNYAADGYLLISGVSPRVELKSGFEAILVQIGQACAIPIAKRVGEVVDRLTDDLFQRLFGLRDLGLELVSC